MNNQASTLAYAGQYLKLYETPRYTFLERNLRFSDGLYSIIVQPDAEDFGDVSFWQRGMNWDEYAEHARAVILRIGQNIWEDTEFQDNYTQAKAHLLAVGGYFFYDGRVSPQQQAEVIIRAMTGKSFEMELLIDWEYDFGGAYEGLPNVVKLMQLCQGAGISCKAVGIYTGYYFFIENSNSHTNAPEYTYLAQHPLWEAWYAAAIIVKVPPPWTDWTHWQYGTIDEDWGQPTEELDRNKHNGTKAQFEERYLGEIVPPEPPDTGGMMKGKIKTGYTVNIRDANNVDVGDLLAGDAVYGTVFVDTRERIRFLKVYRADGTIDDLGQQCTAVTKNNVAPYEYYMELTNEAEPSTPPPANPITDVHIKLAPGSIITTTREDGSQSVETA